MRASFLIPESLQTPRLQLRMFQDSDWAPLCEMFRDEDSVRYTLGTPATDWMTWRFLAGYLGHWQLRGYGPYAVVEKASGNMMGPVGMWCPGDWPEPEIKYSLAKIYWGKGYASEAAMAVKEMVARELKWKRLISLIAPENVASKAVAKKLGGVYEKTLPFRGSTAEVYAYAL